MKMLLTPILAYLGFFITQSSFAQNVGIGTNSPHPSAKLDIDDANKGLLIPRVSLTNVLNAAPIALPATGLLVYNQNNSISGGYGAGFYYWTGSSWSHIGRDNVINGLHYSIPSNATKLGGPLVEHTTISPGNFEMIYNLNGSGDFNIQDAGITHFQVRDNGYTYFGDDTYWRDGSVSGTVLARLYDSGDDGVFQLYRNGAIQHTISSIGTTVFNEQSGPYDFRIESDNNVSMFFMDASTNRIGIGTTAPVDRFHVEGGRVEFTATTDANGTMGSGVLEIGNSLRIDPNEIITNNNSILYLQNDNNGDLRVDGLTFSVDASLNRVGIGTSTPSATIDVRGDAIFNELSGNFDFRVESDARSHALWIDASTNIANFGSANASAYGNGTTINGSTVQYVADFDLGGAVWDGTAIGIGSIEYLLDGVATTLINNSFGPTNHMLEDLATSTLAWDDVYADNFVNISDKREKENIESLSYGLKEIMAMRPVSYTLKRDPFGDKKLGLIAQEALLIVPEAVKTHDNKIINEDSGKYERIELERMGMTYQQLIPVLIQATQEQQELINQLRKEIEVLKNE